jgi:hypothetical protein
MQLFVLHQSPSKSAELLFELDRRRAMKQIVELCQMLATLTDEPVPKKDGGFYKKPKSIRNHPVTLGISSKRGLKSWAMAYLSELLKCSGNGSHGCLKACSVLSKGWVDEGVPEFGWFGSVPMIVPDDIFESYRLYILFKQKGLY